MRWAIAWGWSVVAAGAGCTFEPVAQGPGGAGAAVDAAVDAAPAPMRLRIAADIDGRSELYLQGATARWMHYEFAAPGREQFVDVPTQLGALAWYPTWPDIPDAENRDCGCSSSTSTALPSAVPSAAWTVTLSPVQARRAPTVMQQPVHDNGYTLVIEFDDTGLSGSSMYIVDVAIDPP